MEPNPISTALHKATFRDMNTCEVVLNAGFSLHAYLHTLPTLALHHLNCFRVNLDSRNAKGLNTGNRCFDTVIGRIHVLILVRYALLIAEITIQFPSLFQRPLNFQILGI